jgi:hypothetical protein
MWWRFKEYVVAVAPVIARTLVLSTASLVVSDGLRRAGILLARRVLESLPGGMEWHAAYGVCAVFVVASFVV